MISFSVCKKANAYLFIYLFAWTVVLISVYLLKNLIAVIILITAGLWNPTQSRKEPSALTIYSEKSSLFLEGIVLDLTD